MPLQSYLEFVSGGEVWIGASESTYIILVLDHGTNVGNLNLNKLNVSLRGEVKLMLKHIMLLARDSEGRSYNDTVKFQNDLKITTSLDWEMNDRQILIYFKDYVTTSAFVFMVFIFFWMRSLDLSACPVGLSTSKRISSRMK